MTTTIPYHNVYSKKRVLVTGGAGFIGSHVTEELVKRGAKVTVADDLSRGTLTNLKSVYNKFRFLHLDLRIEKNAVEACKNQDIVFNLAALNTGVDFDKGRTHIMFEENALLQMMPLRAAAASRVKTFVQISSASIYSTAAMVHRSPTKETDTEGEPEKSKLGYALAKRMGEHLAQWYAKESDMRTVIARLINVYGVRDHFDDLGHFIPTIIRKFIHAKKTLEVFGSGQQQRSFLHVKDAVSGILLLGERGSSGEAYNIDAHDEYKIADIVFLIQKALQASNLTIRFNTTLPEGSKKRLLDNSKIIKLGWKPTHSLKHTINTITEDVLNRMNS